MAASVRLRVGGFPMRRSYIQINGVLYEKGTEPYRSGAPMIQPDIGAYRSMVDGSMIEGRKAHREHLRRHGVREVGNDALSLAKPRATGDSPIRKELIRAQVNEMDHRSFRSALKKDINFVKWNSRS